MEIEKLPFKLGMYYENLRLDLKVEEAADRYTVFRYTKDDIQEFEGFEVTDVFLYFNLDVLFQVEMYLEQGTLKFEKFHKVENEISIRGSIENSTKLIEFTYSKDKIWRDL